MGWRPRVAATWAAILVGIGFVAAEAIVLRAPVGDDEGVYWQSLRALARGEPLFSSVFASQPPGFYYAFLPFYGFAHSLTGLRVGVLLFGLVGLAATYVVSRLLGGGLAGAWAGGGAEHGGRRARPRRRPNRWTDARAARRQRRSDVGAGRGDQIARRHQRRADRHGHARRESWGRPAL